MKRFLAASLIFLICFTLFSQQRHSLFSERAPKWVEQTHFVEGNTHYFVGRSSKQLKLEESISRALANALSLVSKYVKADVRSLSKSYEAAFGDESESLVRDVLSERGAQITVRNYLKESYSEKFIAGVDTFYESAVKIAVSSEDLQLMGIKATGITAWNFSTSKCGGDQAEELEMLFKEAATRLGWKLGQEENGPDFSRNLPKTAYFAQAAAKCNGRNVIFSVERYDLVEKMLITSAYSKGDSIEIIKSDLFNSLQIYAPIMDFPEYPDTNNTSVFKNVPADLRELYSKAVNAERKGRLNSEKAAALWENIEEYSGDNPFRDLAKNRTAFYKKMESVISELSADEKKEFEALKKTAASSSFNQKIFVKNLAEYIDRYGAFAGSANVEEILAGIKDKEKRADVKEAVFSHPAKAASWQDSCRQGNPAKCYILSMKADGDSTSLKKYACERKVEKACFDLYTDAKNDKKGGLAALFAEKSCYLGNKNACFATAMILFQGQMSAEKDIKKSLDILEDSCEAKGGESCYMLGVMYDGGTKSVKKSKSKAIELYKKSCELGYEKSCNAY